MIDNLLHNEYFVGCAMAVIIFGLTQLLKLPIKHFTSKIVNERARKIVNATILLIPFILGVIFEMVFSTYYLEVTISIVRGLSYGTAGISIYSFFERFLKVKIDNPYETEEGEAVQELIENVTADGQVSEGDSAALQEFFSKVK